MVGITAELANQANNDAIEKVSKIIDFGKFGPEGLDRVSRRAAYAQGPPLKRLLDSNANWRNSMSGHKPMVGEFAGKRGESLIKKLSR
jgi:hypothetical protein